MTINAKNLRGMPPMAAPMLGRIPEKKRTMFF